MLPEGEFNIPPIYPDGGPLRWQDEVSGVLPTAIRAFTFHHMDAQKEVTTDHLEIVRRYLEYYINAPCWQIETMEQQFADLRQSIQSMKNSDPLTIQDLDAWLWKALEIGIDPL